jgi:hypothetical protein
MPKLSPPNPKAVGVTERCLELPFDAVVLVLACRGLAAHQFERRQDRLLGGQ